MLIVEHVCIHMFTMQSQGLMPQFDTLWNALIPFLAESEI